MMKDRFCRNIFPAPYYNNIFEAIPRGIDNGISYWEFACMLKYEYDICPYEEARKVISSMQDDGYIVIVNKGMIYRAKDFKELVSVYGSRAADIVFNSPFWMI